MRRRRRRRRRERVKSQRTHSLTLWLLPTLPVCASPLPSISDLYCDATRQLSEAITLTLNPPTMSSISSWLSTYVYLGV
ncbi:hypothetical protein AMTR_s00023p00178080 [Amborella trichopoda]|uniref:Secreted protein n=1 Tax=Amborella trichopoda TaxID=13333 RepID=W1NJK6_AMBTC|nr:hypothetical protein AMTR_s00023p00178080 [Amborella trichopoda]